MVDYKIDEEELFRTKGQKMNMETDKTKSSILGKRNTTSLCIVRSWYLGISFLWLLLYDKIKYV